MPVRLVALLLAALSALFDPTHLPAQTHGALGNPTGRPIGGGEDYGDWVSGGIVVSDRAQLLQALAAATPGTTIYVHDDAQIDVSGLQLVLPRDVTLASGRGRNGSLGGMLFSTTRIAAPLLTITGDARVTGLRIVGPDTNIEPGNCGGDDAIGIQVVAPEWEIWWVRVDNNEMWGWPNSAVSSLNVWGVQVQHNHIHHCRRQVRREGCRAYGLGYGVSVYTAGHTLIEANLFDHNRHDIACDGVQNTSYEARYNLVLTGNVQHSFDVHGGADRRDGTDIAGTLFWVHHNTFLQDDKPAFRIRGRPVYEARVWGNEFRHTSESAAADQTNASGNFYRYDNRVGVNHFPAWFVSFSGTHFWRLRRFDATPMSAVHLADFDGDGCADAFTAADGRWQLASGARLDWQTINASSATMSQLRFGDFDGDGRTDVFRVNGSAWQVSYGGTGLWTPLNSSTTLLSSLGFADFDGDRRTDVFWATGAVWRVRYGGVGPWYHLNVSDAPASALAFGDFDGDGRADVFRTDGRYWWVSLGGTGAWQPWNTSVQLLGALMLGDLDGDGRTDVFLADGATWRVSWSGNSAWEHLQSSALAAPALRLADVNGDGKADVLSVQSPD